MRFSDGAETRVRPDLSYRLVPMLNSEQCSNADADLGSDSAARPLKKVVFPPGMLETWLSWLRLELATTSERESVELWNMVDYLRVRCLSTL